MKGRKRRSRWAVQVHGLGAPCASEESQSLQRRRKGCQRGRGMAAGAGLKLPGAGGLNTNPDQGKKTKKWNGGTFHGSRTRIWHESWEKGRETGTEK